MTAYKYTILIVCEINSVLSGDRSILIVLINIFHSIKQILKSVIKELEEEKGISENAMKVELNGKSTCIISVVPQRQYLEVSSSILDGHMLHRNLYTTLQVYCRPMTESL